MRDFTSSDLRNPFGVINFIELDEIEAAVSRPVPDAWDNTPNQFAAIFRQSNDTGREALASLINRKLGKAS